MQDLIQSVLPMKLDIYKQIDSQNSDTGAIVKEWQYYKTLEAVKNWETALSKAAKTDVSNEFANTWKMYK